MEENSPPKDDWSITEEEKIPFLCNSFGITKTSAAEVILRFGYKDEYHTKTHLIKQIAMTYPGAKNFVKFLAQHLGIRIISDDPPGDTISGNPRLPIK